MLMLQSITLAINVKNSGNKLLFKFSSLFLLHCVQASLTCWYLQYGTLLLPLMLLTATAKKKTCFMFILMELQAEQQTAFMCVQKCNLANSRFLFAYTMHAKNSLSKI